MTTNAKDGGRRIPHSALVVDDEQGGSDRNGLSVSFLFADHSDIETWRVMTRTSTGESLHAAAETDAVTIGCDTSDNLVVDTLCPDSIHFGATFRSSSGRFIVNAATTRC